MLAWLAENKTWIFEGIGVAVPLAGVGWLAKRYFDNKKSAAPTTQTQTAGPNSTNYQAGGDISIGKSKE